MNIVDVLRKDEYQEKTKEIFNDKFYQKLKFNEYQDEEAYRIFGEIIIDSLFEVMFGK